MTTTSPKILLVNTGKNTVALLRGELGTAAIQNIYSRKLILHITRSGTVACIYKNTPLQTNYAHVFIRRRGHDEELCGILAEHFSAHNISVSDPINLCFTNAESKMAQMPRLANAGLKVPETIILTAPSFNANRTYITNTISYPIVYKENGSRGEKVFLLDTEEQLVAHIDKLAPGAVCMIQTYIPNQFDTRTIVAYGHVLGTIKRTAAPGHFHNNVSKGGTVAAYTLTPAECDYARNAISVCKLDVGGVDFIHTESGPVILEVNKSPQLQGFERVYGESFVFREIATYWKKTYLDNN
jgi:ribosomal protein S6--L-glutamate ligase